MRRLLTYLCLSFALVSIGLDEARADTRVALVIGNSAYRHTTALKNPANDSRTMKATLERLGFKVVEGHDLTRADFEKKLREFVSLVSGADMALLFYAGHALQVDGENWLIPVDSDVRSEMDLDLGAISLGTVLKTMEHGARVRLVFLDACRDNPMATPLAEKLGARSASVGRGLARVEAGVGTLIAYSTQPGATAADGGGEHSPFATALLDMIETPGLEIRQMLTRVRAKVVDATHDAQVPWDHSSLTGDVFFSAPAQVAATGPTTTALPPIQSSRNPACRRAQERIDALSFWARDFNQRGLTRDAETCLKEGDAEAWGYFLRGSSRWFDLEDKGAIEDFDKAISLRPDYLEAYLSRALMLIDSDVEKARRDLDKALQLDPDSAKAHAYLGAVAFKQGDAQRALKACDRATEIDPSLIDPYIGRGVIYQAREDWPRVIEELTKVIELNNAALVGYVGRARAYANTGERTKAEADLTKALSLDPDEPAVYSVRATLFFNNGDVDRALEDFNKALSLKSDAYEALAGRARCWIEKQDNDRALEDLNALSRLRQDDPDVFQWRGYLLALDKKYSEAIADLDRALALKPKNEARVLYERANAYAKLGRKSEAIADLKRAQELMPDQAEIKAALKDLEAQ